MARAIALLQSFAPTAGAPCRTVVVCACALALIFAGKPLPL